MSSVWPIVFGLVFLLAVHEAGHYLAARLLRVHVSAINVGIGPTLLRFALTAETELHIKLLPLLGYVSFDDQRDLAASGSAESQLVSYRDARPLHRVAILLGGAAANYLLATCLVFYLTAAGHLGQRAGRAPSIDLPDALHMALVLPVECVHAQALALGELMAGEFGRMQGPIAVSAELAAEAARGADAYISLLVLLSIGMGFFNLLPIPGLDGGRIVFEAWSAVTRRPLSASLEARLHGGCAMLLLMLVLGWSVREADDVAMADLLAPILALLVLPVGIGAASGMFVRSRGYGWRILGALVIATLCLALINRNLTMCWAALVLTPLLVLGYVLARPAANVNW